MKILQIAPFFAPKMGGSAQVVFQTSAYMAQMGHDVTVVASTYGLQESQFDVAAFQVVFLPNLIARAGFYLSPGIIRWAQAHLSEFDIIHLHEFRTFQNIVSASYARLRGVPYVLSAHGTLPIIVERKTAKRVFDWFFGQRILDNATRLIAVSPQEVDQYTQAGIAPERVSVVRNGLNLQEFGELPPKGAFRRKLDLAKTTPIILFLGRLHRRKGIDVLVDAFARLRSASPDTILVIAGPDGGVLEQLREQVAVLELQDSVIFPGPLYGADKLAAYVDADVVASTGIYEIFGLVPFEALMCGAPVIVSDDCGAGALIREAQAGMTVPYGDSEALAEALYQTLINRAAAAANVARGQTFIRARLDWRANVATLIALYTEVLKRHADTR